MSYDTDRVLRAGVQRNAKSIAAFVENAAFAERSFSPSCLKGRAFRVSGPIDEPQIKECGEGERVSGLIHIGGEMCNSWTTNYELHTFIAGAMLAAAATALKGRFGEYRSAESSARRRMIERDIRSLDEHTLLASFRRPAYGILSQFVDDIEGDRYSKAQLWGLAPRSNRRFVQNIARDDIGHLAHHEPTELYTQGDIELARLVLAKTVSLFEAKAMQMHFSVRAFLSRLGIDSSTIPLYFSSTPNLHISSLDDGHPFFSMLAATAASRKLYGNIVQEDKPWIVKTPCPNCGIESKYIIKAKLGADGKTSRATCQEKEITLRNEVGWETGTLRGCGFQWEEKIPDSGREMAAYLKARAVGLHFPANMSVMLMRSGLPVVGSMFEDPGLVYEDGVLTRPPNYPTGDNPDMIMSVMATWLAVACGRLGGLPPDQISSSAPLMMSQHPQITDPIVKQVKRGIQIESGTTNSSITALYRHGMSPMQIFDATLSLQAYPFGVIQEYRRRLDVAAMMREAAERGIYVVSG